MPFGGGPPLGHVAAIEARHGRRLVGEVVFVHDGQSGRDRDRREESGSRRHRGALLTGGEPDP